MSKSYTKEYIKGAVKSSKDLRAQITVMFSELSYNEEFWNSTDHFPQIAGIIIELEELEKGMKAHQRVTGKRAEKVTKDLKFITNCYNHIKEYHCRNAKRDQQARNKNKSAALKNFREIEIRWQPLIEEAVKGKRWDEATRAILKMPYQYKQNARLIMNRNIKDPAVIMQSKALDKFIIKICQKIPARVFKKAAKEFYQAKINNVCAQGVVAGETISGKFSKPSSFLIEKVFAQQGTLQKDKKKLDNIIDEIVNIRYDYNDFLKLGERSKEN